MTTHENRIIGMLPSAVFERIAGGSQVVAVAADDVLVDAGDFIRDAFFPLDAVVSIDQVIDPDGEDSTSSPGVALVGNEGVVGLEAFFGAEAAINRATVRIAGRFMKVPIAPLKEEFLRSGALQRVLLRSADAFLTQLCGNSSCERVHPIQQRLIRWLLLFDDRCETSELVLKQSELAQILAVRRVSISAAAALLQLAGEIDYHRGTIVVTNRDALELKACHCYRQIKKRYDEYLLVDD